MISTQFIIGMLNGPVAQFVSFFQTAESAAISFKRLNDIYQIPEEENQSSANNLELPISRTLTLRNVSFQYTPQADLVLKNLNLIIPEGKITAIVGPSGSGKTTLLKLLMRLYHPSYGQIDLGNMALRNLSLRQWRKLCGSVLQEGKLFNDTILNNIVLNDEQTDYVWLRKAVQTANIANEIETLPLGYHTRVGETGRGLSQGQKQRILLARAIYQNPDYLFLDEATNALDTINEQKIMESLDEFFRARTVVVAAHRLSTIRKANQIIVMKEGSIVEKGTHEELLHNRGTYYSLIKAQLSNQEVEEAEKTRRENTDLIHILKDTGQK